MGAVTKRKSVVRGAVGDRAAHWGAAHGTRIALLQQVPLLAAASKEQDASSSGCGASSTVLVVKLDSCACCGRLQWWTPRWTDGRALEDACWVEREPRGRAVGLGCAPLPC